MKNLLKGILAIAILFSATASFGQEMAQAPQQRAWNQLQWMKKNLSITDDQSQKIFPILFQSATKMENLKTAPAGTDRRAEMKNIQTSKENDIKAILNADQYTKYQAHQMEMKEKMAERRSEATSGN